MHPLSGPMPDHERKMNDVHPCVFPYKLRRVHTVSRPMDVYTCIQKYTFLYA